jgi:hypothetical protein
MHSVVRLFTQSVRDAIIVTSCGAEALPFITAFGVLPASFLFFMYYDKLVSHCSVCWPAASDAHQLLALSPRIKFLCCNGGFCSTCR